MRFLGFFLIASSLFYSGLSGAESPPCSEAIMARVEAGHALRGDEAYARALAKAIFILADAPDCAQGHFLRGSIYLELGEYEEAEESLEYGISLNPASYPGYLQLAAIAMAEADWGRALALTQTAVDLAPEYEGALAMRAEVLTNLDRVEEAVADYTRIIEVHGPTFGRLDDRCKALILVDDFVGAEAAIQEMLELEPGKQTPWRRRLQIASKQNDTESFDAVLKEALETATYSDYIRYTHAQQLYYQGELEAGREQMEQAVAIDPYDADYWRLLGDFYFDLNEDAQAAMAYSEVYALDPTDADALLDRGYSAYYSGNEWLGLLDALTYGRLAPESPYGPYLAGLCLHWLERYEGAIPHFQEANRRAPEEAYIVAAMGGAQFRAGQTDAASETLQTALEMDPESIEAQEWLAELMAEEGTLVFLTPGIDTDPMTLLGYGLALLVMVAVVRTGMLVWG
jgi:tetratricopeptide (TPR) repeat protein